MLNTVDLSVNLFSAVATYFLAAYFFASFGERKKHPIVNALSIILLAAFFLSVNFAENRILSIIIMVLCVFTLGLKYDFKLYNKILFTVLFVIISALSELIAGLTVVIAFSLDSIEAFVGVYYYLGAVISKLLAFLFFFIIRSFNILIFRIVDGIIDSSMNESKLYVSEEIIKQQTEQYELLLKNNDEILKLKHDYKNFVIGILAEIKNKNYKTIEDRLTEQASVLNEFSGNSITGNSIIDTVLGYKRSVAKSKSIDILVTHKNLQKIGVSGIDMAILLGNAIDNAIEAAELLDDVSLRRIEVLLYNKNGQIFITVKNPVKADVDVSDLRTTKENSFSHGYGILNMKNIAEKYGGSVTFDCTENVFSTFIIIQNIDE